MSPESLVYAVLYLPSQAVPATPENPTFSSAKYSSFVARFVVLSFSATDGKVMGVRNLLDKDKAESKLIT